MKRILLLAVLCVMLTSCASLTGRTTGEYMDDASITSEINVEIVKDPALTYLKINVDSFRGHVTLTGVVPSKADEQHLINVAGSVRGVKSVKSNLIIEEQERQQQPKQ